jgi:uncharacterized protein YcbX
MPTITRFNVTPVKSTRLHHPEAIRFEMHGVPGDRDFFPITQDGRLFAGSKLGPLVRIVADHDEERDTLRVRFPDGIDVEGPAANDGDPMDVNFYGRNVPAHVVDGPWTEPLSRYARRDLRLARVDRPGDGNDVRPITLVSLASVDELARRGGSETVLDPRRFRMTLEMDGIGAHEEDGWDGRRIRVGDAVLLVESQVPRCVVTTQDPSTGVRDFPTLKVIKSYRGVTEDKQLPFGMYASVVEPGQARLGDPVELLP